MTVRNYTTQISTIKTISEIETILLKFGAKGIYKEYIGNNISSIQFFLEHKGERIQFKLPSNIEKARKIISNAVTEKKLPLRYQTEPLRTEQGERVMWRIMKDWIDSQLSLLEMNYADAIEILLPYAYDSIENKTLYQKFIENKSKFIAIGIKEV